MNKSQVTNQTALTDSGSLSRDSRSANHVIRFVIHNTRRKASALLFTLLIVGLVSSLAFFVGRSAVRESRIISADRNSLGAYYTAEAGLEDGLARIAADHNIEAPTCWIGHPHGGAGSASIAPCDSTDVARYANNASWGSTGFNTNLSITDLTLPTPKSFPSRIRVARFGADGGRISNVPSALNSLNINVQLNAADQPAGQPNDYVYDLRITSRTQKFGNANGINATNPCAAAACGAADAATLIKNGNVKEFNVYSGVGNPDAPAGMNIFWNCNQRACVNNQDILIITFVYNCPAGTPAGTECTQDVIKRGISAGLTIPVPELSNATNNLVKIRIKPVSSDPNFVGVNLSMVLNNGLAAPAPVYFKGDVATVQSIGYFAGIKRRLEAKVDRNSGALLGLFDYAVYAGNSFTQPN